jgi:hypothetical protein
MSPIAAGRDDKVVCDRQRAGDVEDDDVLTLSFVGQIGDRQREV